MWHHERSTIGVTIAASAWCMPSLSATAVIRPTAAPAARAARIASIVARVPPSWLTPITPAGSPGSSRASNAWRAVAGLPASLRISATPSAACSLVPQPTMSSRPGVRASSANAAVSTPVAICSSSAGSASIISAITHGGPSRSSGKASVYHSGVVVMPGFYGASGG